MKTFYKIALGDFTSYAAQALVTELDRYLASQYKDYEPNLYGMQPAELAVSRSGFWLASVADQAIGCVALRPVSDKVAELKRFYVKPTFRKQGIGRQLLVTAESAAIAWKYTHLCLETGEAQSASIRLYEQTGFQAIPCFGKYVDPESRCYKKVLS